MSVSAIKLPERITVENANAVMLMLCQFAERTEQASIDLSSVEYCDSAGVACLLEAKIHANANKHVLTFVQPNSQLKALVTFLKIDRLLL